MAANNYEKSGSERQYFFIEQLKEHYRNRGRKLSYSVVTFGCQMNARDSEKLSGILAELGAVEAEEEEAADIIIFNTCTVRENANEHLYGRLGRLKQRKKNDPDMIIGICGCMMQEKDEVEKIRKKYPYIDLIFGTHNFYTFPELLYDVYEKRNGVFHSAPCSSNELIADSDDDIRKAERLKNYGSAKNLQELKKLYSRPVISVWKDTKDIVEELPSKRKFSFKQGVNIMYGCNNFCSYCIVPYVRGREKSREKADILNEIRRLGEDGVKEIMLLGQNVNSYGKNLAEPVSFAELLKEVDELAGSCGIERIRFMTSHPKDLSDELIKVMAEGKHIMHQFHLPLQSGSDSMLKVMNRHYDKASYLEKAAKLKAAMPDISISTDIIVGFPGETEEDFQDTLDVVSKVRYDSAFTFIYSKREGTPAAKMENQIDPETVKDRFDRLVKLQQSIASENCEALVGKTLPAMFEEVNEHDPELVTGRLENNMVVHVKADASVIGTIRNVRLEEAHGFYFTGRL